MPFDKSRCPCDCKSCSVCCMFGIGYPAAMNPTPRHLATDRRDMTPDERRTLDRVPTLFDEVEPITPERTPAGH